MLSNTSFNEHLPLPYVLAKILEVLV